MSCFGTPRAINRSALGTDTRIFRKIGDLYFFIF